MAHNYLIQSQTRPEQNIVFTSIDRGGEIGPLVKYVLMNSGIKAQMPESDDLDKGFYISSDGDRTLVFIVTMFPGSSPDNLLRGNLKKALEALNLEDQDRSMWFPLMGTGYAKLPYRSSAALIKTVLDEIVTSDLSKVVISLPNEVDRREQIQIERIFNPDFVPEPPLPEEIDEQIDQFLQKFPASELPQMTLQRYSNIKNRDYFTYGLEHETADVGRIKGGSSFKFGIFRRRNTEQKISNNNYSYTQDYAWYTRYGATKEAAFSTILSHIVSTVHYAASGQIKEISKIPLHNTVKWKIAFLYQNFQRPTIVSIYKREALRELSELSPGKFSTVKAHEILISRKPKDQDVWSYSRDLWRLWSNGATDNEETTEDEQDIQLDNEVVHITGFVNDGLAGDDKLGMSNEIEALASIIAYKKTAPPLSVGIFGEWGSGKSFYMSQLEDCVARLARSARNSNIPQRLHPFYKHIKQIRFNAWNYVESDLWASLAHTIYTNLATTDEEPDQQDPYWLSIVKYGEDKAKEKANKIKELKTKLGVINGNLEDLAKTEQDLQTRSFEFDENAYLQEQLMTDIKSQGEDFLQEMGLNKELKTVQDAVSLTQELSSLSNRFSLFYKAVAKTDWKTTAFLIFLPILVFAVSFFGLSNFYENSGFAAGITSLFALIGTSVSWCKARVKTVSDWLSRYEKIQLDVSGLKNQKQAKLQDDKAKNLKDLKETLAQIKQTQDEKQLLEKGITEARLILNDLTPESVLAHHISETIGDNRYGKFLGLPAVLSKDFESLASTIQKQNEALEDPRQFPTLEKENSAEDAKHRINRIVLYIDDLDRCEPETVVKVLEAVHLFLASPLFIVVLGVDPRWLFSSIREHYAALMKTGEAVTHNDLAASTPEEYLEKIFQVPIWLENPNAKSVQALMNGIIGTVVTEGNSFGPSARDTQQGLGEEKDKQTADGNTAENNEGSNTDKSAPDLANQRRQFNTIGMSESDPLVKAQQHQLEASEVEFINGLSHILGRSPRSVKRYLNLYRLIKSSLKDSLYDDFIHSKDGNAEGFKSVAFLLAVVVGSPAMATAVFKLCAEISKPTSIADVLKLLKNIDSPNEDARQSFDANCKQLSCLDEKLSGLQIWVKVVARYSYSKLDVN